MSIKKHLKDFKKREFDTHKGDFGHVFVVAGSPGHTGAAFLTAQAAIFCGSGLVTLAIPESLNDIMEVKLTEVMTLPVCQTSKRTFSQSSKKVVLDFAQKSDVCALGPGMSLEKSTVSLIKKLVPAMNVPLVLDADGINAVSQTPQLLKKRRSATVITPHLKEMSRLTGRSVEHIKKFKENVAKEFALKYNVVVVLKGHKTVVASSEGQTYICQCGNSGMSTAGTGDVLTGMIASLIGQGLTAFSASVLGVYIHGKTGDLAAKEKGQFSLIATDLLRFLPNVLKEIV